MDTSRAASRIINKNLSKDNDDAFYILDLANVRVKYENWIDKIPRVVPYYAVKCNDDERVLKLLRDLGAGFDCASKKELLQILNLNVDPKRIIYAHTVKQMSHLKLAAKNGINKVTFDSIAELHKIQKLHPNAEVVLRIRFDASSSVINLGPKFGCDPQSEAPKLIKLCQELNMNLIGIAFHVGSGTKDYTVFEDALDAVKKLFVYSETLGMKLNFVDIGGGFMGTDLPYFDNFAKSINTGIERNFPIDDVEIIAEPGRYFVDSAFSIVAQVILKKMTEHGQMFYYLNESIYMSFLISFLYKEHLDFSIIKKSKNHRENGKFNSTIWGCTCSSLDKIIENIEMPEMEIGDWMIFHNMGAYTSAVSTSFNGFSNKNVYLMDEGILNGEIVEKCSEKYFTKALTLRTVDGKIA